ncbi:MAG: GSCFA domain-containing protein [Alistipes sp.]
MDQPTTAHRRKRLRAGATPINGPRAGAGRSARPLRHSALGTAWVYELRETGRIVANCQSCPQRCSAAGE